MIELLAMQEPFADYILNDREDVMNVYIHANMADRCTYAVNTYEMHVKDVEEAIHKIDKH